MTIQADTREGKTKIVTSAKMEPGIVWVKNRDDITAHNGARRDVIPGKGAACTQTTVNAFHFLERCGIPTAFVRTASPHDTFVARECQMIPIEWVMRRYAWGSYLDRHPSDQHGRKFREPLMECFHKDDAAGDPLTIFTTSSNVVSRYHAHRPISERTLKDRKPIWTTDLSIMLEHGDLEGLLDYIQSILRLAFLALEEAWAALDFTLVDCKFEIGFDPEGRVVIADVIDNDSWRLWHHGNCDDDYSKQCYRDIPPGLTDVEYQEALDVVRDKYLTVAKASEKFAPKSYRLS